MKGAAQMICRDNQWWSVFGKKRGKNGKRPGPPVHDDLVKRDFSADDVNELWLTDIPPQAGGAPSEHWTDEGKLYLCAADSTGRRNTSTSEVFEYGHGRLEQEDERRASGASSSVAC